jgi:glycine/serine hydroxymethyltransferase
LSRFPTAGEPSPSSENYQGMTHGMKEPEMAAIADMISEVLLDIKNGDAAHKVRNRVRALTAKFPLPY